MSRVSTGNLKDFMPDIGDVTDLVRSLRLGVAALIAGSGPLLVLVILVPGLAMMSGLGDLRGAPAEAEPPVAPVVLGEAGPMADVEAASEPGPPPAMDTATGLKLVGLALWMLLMGVITLAWKVVYTPVALTVAGISRSAVSTLNPAVGLDTIRRMGVVYWQAMAIYTALTMVQWVLGVGFGFIPFVGSLGKAFVDAYAFLAIGCTLGLAVFKKAPELDLE